MSDIMATPPQPVNYSGMQIQADPVNSFLKASQAQANIGLTQAQQQQTQQQTALLGMAQQRQQAFADQWQQFVKNPTPLGAIQMATANPEWAGQISGSWNNFTDAQRQQTLNQLVPIASSLQNGRYDLANDLVQQHIDAVQNTPGYENNQQLQLELATAKDAQRMIQADQQNGTHTAQAYVLGTLAAAQGPQEFAKHFVESQTVPAGIETANIAPAQAAANVGVTQSQAQDLQSIIANRAATFGLDQQKFQTDVALKLRELNYQQNAPNMDPALRAQADQAAADSVAHDQMAQRIGTLAQNIGTMNASGQWVAGKPEDIRAGWQNFWGDQDQVNTLRNELQSVNNSLGAFGGVGLSPKDKNTLTAGLPPKNAGNDQIQAFLQSLQNASLRAARMADGKSSWAYTYGRLGPATQDANIGGIQVARGTTFPQFMTQLLKAGSTAPSPFAAPNAAPGVQINQPAQPAQGAGQFGGNLSYLNKYTGAQ
jgi:hypothetical protein